MRKKEIYQNGLLCGTLLILFFGSFLANSEITDEGQCWGDLKETYTYIWDSKVYNYKLVEPLSETYKEIAIWDVGSEGNEISFRTDMWEVFIGMIHIENETHYDLYRAAWLYENETESFKVTYRYDNLTQEIGFVDPLSLDLIEGGADVPLNPMEMHVEMFMFWQGLGLTFLPVLHEDFSFETNFTIYELAYPDFEIKFEDTFRFQRKNIEGYHYEFSYTSEFKLYPGVWNREEVSRYYSYDTQGVLYDFYNEQTLSTNISGKYEVESEGTFRYYLYSYDGTVIAAHSWIYCLSGILIISVYMLYKRRR